MRKVYYDFSDEVVIVTGGAKGIGRATAEKFAEAGANLILMDWDGESLEQTKRELTEKYKKEVIAIKGDVSKLEDVERLVKQSIDTFGKIDILFNNAGTTIRHRIDKASFEDYRYIMGVNLDGAFLVAQRVVREMIKRRDGVIVNTASMSAFEIQRGVENTIYCMSKAGIVMMTKGMGAQFAQYNVRVNAIAPGFTATSINRAMVEDPEQAKRLTNPVPMGRFAKPEEMASGVLFLASEGASYVQGETLLIDGGATCWLNA